MSRCIILICKEIKNNKLQKGGAMKKNITLILLIALVSFGCSQEDGKYQNKHVEHENSTNPVVAALEKHDNFRAGAFIESDKVSW